MLDLLNKVGIEMKEEVRKESEIRQALEVALLARLEWEKEKMN
jgi:hypothetical protein